MLERSDVDVPNDLACLFFFAVDNRWSKVLIKHGKRWPAGMTTEEKLSLCEGDFVEIKCGPKYNIKAQGEFLLQGDERSIGKTVNEICKRRENGLDISQVDALKIYDEVNAMKEREYDSDHVPLSDEERQKKVPKLQHEVAIFERDEIPDDPEIECELFNEFLNFSKKRLAGAEGTSSKKQPEPPTSGSGEVSGFLF